MEDRAIEINLSGQHREKRLKKQMNSTSGNFETVIKDLMFREEVTEGWNDKEIMFQNFPIFVKGQNPIDSRRWMNLKYDWSKEIHTKIHHSKTSEN